MSIKRRKGRTRKAKFSPQKPTPRGHSRKKGDPAQKSGKHCKSYPFLKWPKCSRKQTWFCFQSNLTFTCHVNSVHTLGTTKLETQEKKQQERI